MTLTNSTAQIGFAVSQGTSSGWSLPQLPMKVILSGLLVIGGPTVPEAATAASFIGRTALVGHTTAGLSIMADQQATSLPKSAATDINRLRRLTGLTWEQLAHMLGTSRRSVHGWASGTRLSAMNQERVARTLATMEAISCGRPAGNRALLLAPVRDGRLLVDLFRQGHYDEARAAADAIKVAHTVAGESKPPAASWNITHIDARQDPVHEVSSGTRAVRTILLKPMP